MPLAEAWRSGADDWTDERRRTFANDLAELLTVAGETNASKADQDPAAWRPKRSLQCEYAIRWVDIKFRWRLVIDTSEKRALDDMLGFC